MTDPKTLARTENPQTSKDAAEKMVKSGALDRQGQIVYDAILIWEKHYGNFTTKDIANSMCGTVIYSRDKCYEICRRRFSDLEMKNKIELIRIGFDKITLKHLYKRRDGCRVWRLL